MFEEDKVQKKTKVVRKITQQRLRNIALYYLKRFESSVANLRSVLQRRVNDYAKQEKNFDKAQAYQWIEEILHDFEDKNYLNDERYSEIKIKNYIATGKSPRYIINKLREKGVAEETAERLMDLEEYNPFDAALKLARKKHIGPYSISEEVRKERRSKDMAILVRAGFDYDVVVKVLEFENNQ